eukprot:COSAG02_NODE_1520_length_12166_cov_8.338195_12_plen_181_part_00
MSRTSTASPSLMSVFFLNLLSRASFHVVSMVCCFHRLNQTALFRSLGFYAKALPTISNASYAIVLNTNLGRDNPRQLAALNHTIGAIAARHASSRAVPSVYVLGHHPSIMGGGVATVCASMISGPLSATCREMVKGVFAGHVHTAASTTGQLFTLVPALTQVRRQLLLLPVPPAVSTGHD